MATYQPNPEELAKLRERTNAILGKLAGKSLLKRTEEHHEQINGNNYLSLSPIGDSSISTDVAGGYYARDVVLNKEQLRAVSIASSGDSFCLIGPAGTGKTTTIKAILQNILDSKRINALNATTNILKPTDPGMVVCAYTRRATANAARHLPSGVPSATIHSLLNFVPVTEEVGWDETKGKPIVSLRFRPKYHRGNKLPSTLKLVVIDEASMVSVNLHKELLDALHPGTQLIYLGDLAQLPPVFGDAILGYKLNELPVVELTQIYRQKDGEILDFATRIREGKQIPPKDFGTSEYQNERLNIRIAKSKASLPVRIHQFGVLFQNLIHSGEFKPLDGDLALIPFNKSIGSIELNKYAADYYDQLEGRKIYSIISGFGEVKFAIGDKILVNKNDCIITGIENNPKYFGKLPPAPTIRLNRWGGPRETKFSPPEVQEQLDNLPDELDSLLMAHDSMALEELLADGDSATQQASHIIKYQYINYHELAEDADEPPTHKISLAGEINKIELAYCITVHKAQGSQADHVVLFLSEHHRVMLSRELLYTACTRAKKQLTIYCDPPNINKAINSPRIQGNTIKEKAEFFKGRAKERQED